LFSWYLANRWNDSEKISVPKVVDYQPGRLQIPSGRNQSQTTKETKVLRGQQIEYKTVTELNGWFDAKTSPLISTATRSRKFYQGDRVNNTSDTEIMIQDSGSDAKTQLPEH